MYEDMTFDVIMSRMMDSIPDDMDKREGSIIWDALAPAAIELQLTYIEFDAVLNESFAATAQREYLILRCAERGIAPYLATNAILKGEFIPPSIDMEGKRFSLGTLNYAVTDKISDGVYKVQCESQGVEGNQSFGRLIPIEYVMGLESAQLTEVLIPGEDDEDTEALRERYFLSFGDKAFGGNEKDYLLKTNAVDGVGSTKVTRIWAGPGTVKLTVLNSDFNKASDILIDAVQAVIDPLQDAKGDGLAPIGHVVTVDTVQEVIIDLQINFEFEQDSSFATKSALIYSAVEAYLLELRTGWAAQNNLIVRTAQIETRILALEGIVDIGNTRINGLAENLILTAFQIPVIGVITDAP